MVVLRHVFRLCKPAFNRFGFENRSLLYKSSIMTNYTSPNASYSVIERGSQNTPNSRIFLNDESGAISPFHDIPLHANDEKTLFNMLVEIPRWTNAKHEIATKEVMNPIKQDVKNGLLRFVANCFPHHGYIWNYGALPQTWEYPGAICEHTKCKGDNDPLDICEIGFRIADRGEVITVKPLGVLGLIDEGESDWKVIAIDVNDPMAEKLNDITDIETHCPGLLKATFEWFKIYKIPDGKPPNQFAFNGEFKNKEFALKIIAETHELWKDMIMGKLDTELDRTNVTVEDSPYKINRDSANQIILDSTPPGTAAEVSLTINKWHYVQIPG